MAHHQRTTVLVFSFAFLELLHLPLLSPYSIDYASPLFFISDFWFLSPSMSSSSSIFLLIPSLSSLFFHFSSNVFTLPTFWRRRMKSFRHFLARRYLCRMRALSAALVESLARCFRINIRSSCEKGSLSFAS